MPGIQDAPQQSLNANAASIVVPTAVQPAATSSAVEALANAFRSGYITSADIQDRMGPLGQSKRKAEIQLNTEAVSPEAIVARKTGLGAATAEAQLKTAQAGAGQEVLPGATALQVESNAAQTGIPTMQADLTRQQLRMQSQWMYPSAIMGLVEERLKSTPYPYIDPQSKAQYTKYYNSKGEDVTPGGPVWKEYKDIGAQADQRLRSGAPDIRTPGPLPVQPHNPITPAPSPVTIHINSPPPNPDAGPAMISPSIESNSASAVVQPAGIQTGVAPGDTPPDPASLAEKARASDSYKEWDASRSYFNAAKSAYEEMGKISKPSQLLGANMKALDNQLIMNTLKIMNPTPRAAGEFSFEQLSHVPNYPNSVLNALQKFQGKATLDPESRKELFEWAERSMSARDAAVKPLFTPVIYQSNYWKTRTTDPANPTAPSKYDINGILYPHEIGVATNTGEAGGEGTATRSPGTTSAAAYPRKTIIDGRPAELLDPYHARFTDGK